jgi:hypothetical protein
MNFHNGFGADKKRLHNLQRTKALVKIHDKFEKKPFFYIVTDWQSARYDFGPMPRELTRKSTDLVS